MASSRNINSFRSKNKLWLDSKIQFTCPYNADQQHKAKTTRGRPETVFFSLSERSKRRKTEEIRSSFSPEELCYAAQMQFRAAGKLDTALVMKDVTLSTPTRASKYKKAYTKVNAIQFSSDEALSVFIEAKLTKFQYNIIRDAAKQHNSNLYPNYESITSAKKRCYPQDLVITEGRAEVPLQSLLNHTVSRLFQSLEEVFSSLNSEELSVLCLITKWGCDGSSGMSEYKQKFSDPSISDASIFLTSLVPVQLVSGDPNSNEKRVLWQNPRTSSTRYCRPIRLQFQHETTELSVIEMQYIENQISSLNPTKVSFKSSDIFVYHKLLFTMIDGKICNAITDNSSTQKCYLCGLTSKDFNKIDLALNKEILDETRYQFGLSSLHAWIRFFECLLHLSYKLVIRQWQARGKENKEKVTSNKKRIQELFRNEMGLLIDKPKPGFGSTNDGNTARRFFSNPETSARITGIDEEIISRFRIILLTISSGYAIKVDSFKNYCQATARKFVELYSWYNMPTTVHKILIHSPAIIANSILPIGQLGEEAQESRNKDIKKCRESFSRKFSRKQNMEDIFHNLLVSSDPLISSMRKLNPKTLKKYPPEVIKFFDEPDISEKTLELPDDESDSNNSE